MIDFGDVDRSYRAEVVRKGIHLLSLSIPIIYYFISKGTALSILVPLTLAFLLSDVARLLHEPSGRLYQRYFGFLLRAHERNDHGRHLNGATYVLLSAILCVALFPKVIVITAFAILIVSDTSAALVGRKLGRHAFFRKTLEGSAAFLLSGLIVVALAPKIAYLPAEYLIGGIGVLAGALVESSPLSIDDNLSIPLATGGVMWVLYAVLLPSLNVYGLDRLA
jgi:dolichol kinase